MSPPPDFLLTGNAEAVDFICRRYGGAGTPSQYLRKIEKVGDIALDYAAARKSRQAESEAISDGYRSALRRLGSTPKPEEVTAVSLQWLVEIMSLK